MKSILQTGGIAFCALGALVGLAIVSGAQAQPRPLTVRGGYQGACDAAPAPGTVRLWLGHFRGGNAYRSYERTPYRSIITVDWADQYQCFSSRQQCEVWQARLRHAYRGIDSTRTCLPIR